MNARLRLSLTELNREMRGRLWFCRTSRYWRDSLI
jgi:hypothetical protein